MMTFLQKATGGAVVLRIVGRSAKVLRSRGSAMRSNSVEQGATRPVGTCTTVQYESNLPTAQHAT